MPGLVPGIHVLSCDAYRSNVADAVFAASELVDGRPPPTMTMRKEQGLPAAVILAG
jgi:hypothetical protein